MTVKIYESPDGGKTVYERESGSDAPRRQIYPDIMNQVQASSPYNDGWTQEGYKEQVTHLEKKIKIVK